MTGTELRAWLHANGFEDSHVGGGFYSHVRKLPDDWQVWVGSGDDVNLLLDDDDTHACLALLDAGSRERYHEYHPVDAVPKVVEAIVAEHPRPSGMTAARLIRILRDLPPDTVVTFAHCAHATFDVSGVRHAPSSTMPGKGIAALWTDMYSFDKCSCDLDDPTGDPDYYDVEQWKELTDG